MATKAENDLQAKEAQLKELERKMAVATRQKRAVESRDDFLKFVKFFLMFQL